MNQAVATVHSLTHHDFLTRSNGGADENAAGLTDRQLQLLELAARGFTNQLIANQLNVSLITVKKQFSEILVRLNVSNRSEAVALALQRHIIKN